MEVENQVMMQSILFAWFLRVLLASGAGFLIVALL